MITLAYQIEMNYMDKTKILNVLNQMCDGTLMRTLAIEFIDVGVDFLTAKMPVNSTVHQPMGFLHGGASVALAESVGSAASTLLINRQKYDVLGIEIASNHLKSIKEGIVYATARIIHKGSKLHLWEIKITNEKGQLISICKLSNMIVSKK